MVVIEEYAYRCVLSNAKIALMACDLPHVEYKSKGSRGYTKKEYDEAVGANQQIYERYLESQKGVEINLTELIQKA